LPIDQLIVATNANDILHRFMNTSTFSRQTLLHTLSPSMDIVISSNFERALFDAYDRDAAAIADLMARFRSEEVAVPTRVMDQVRTHFDSCSVDDDQTCATIAAVYEESEYVLDPHSAIGVHAARERRRDAAVPVITLATAHPAKFPDAVVKTGNAPQPLLPHYMSDLLSREERYHVLDHDLAALQTFVREQL